MGCESATDNRRERLKDSLRNSYDKRVYKFNLAK